ncbi:MAG: zinc ribbon domain-containing protein [Thermoleophilia bacterium]|nr:zinc ribbon domain-containing protein [Thermoleophilia bacterium]
MGLFEKFGARGRAAKPARTGGSRAGTPATKAGAATRAAQSRSVEAQRQQRGSSAPAKRGKKGAAKRGGERSGSSSAASAQHHERRKRLVAARESTLRDLGGLMLEMYKRNRFREELLLDKCEEVLAIEVEIAHVDQRLFQLAPPTGSGQRPIGRCECGVPILPGQNFCGVCGRSFGTLTQARNCAACGTGLRAADAYCPTCGTSSPSLLDSGTSISQGGRGGHAIEAAAVATRAADTIIISVPPDPEMAPPPLIDSSMTPPPMKPPPLGTPITPDDNGPDMITSLLDDDAPPPLTGGTSVTAVLPLARVQAAATETAIDVAVATATSAAGNIKTAPGEPEALAAVPAGRAARKDAKRRMKATEAAGRERAKTRARAAKIKQAKRGGSES